MQVRAIMTQRMQMCKAKGFVAVDPDNVDAYIPRYEGGTGVPGRWYRARLDRTLTVRERGPAGVETEGPRHEGSPDRGGTGRTRGWCRGRGLDCVAQSGAAQAGCSGQV